QIRQAPQARQVRQGAGVRDRRARDWPRPCAAHPGGEPLAVAGEMNSVVAPKAKVMSDESNLYANLKQRGFEHQIVIHSDKEWVRGDCHTQSIDGFWPL